MNPISNPDEILTLLRAVFHFPSFRANQEAVCRAAVEGHDLLLVMPTGSGKSLCYQLPAVARGGTALVISPLIALMEDQAAKLAALGLRVARIHSAMDRAALRQACVDYLKGELQFLFIAPERLRVPGFPEMLAKRRLALIAIDEAHCISQWGHDFRPDYRMLGAHMQALRPAPVLALTATATAAVQADIVTQLGLVNPARFIHGFRRENLAIEVVETPVPERMGAICRLLAKPAHRPAIVYAPSRRMAEQIAEALAAQLPAAAYHAGLDAETRERVQTAFQSGALEVVVATIAFGMGIDKADVRTVVHAGMPATLEGYYQEIGRAGRDGKPSRTLLMHSYADQRTQDFFLNRDYPPVGDLDRLFRLLGEGRILEEELRERSKMDEESFLKALEKLVIHGGAKVDFEGHVTRGATGWKKPYGAQAQYRAEQFEKVQRFTESSACRMVELVRHFGDEEDAGRACGVCDVCDPEGAVLKLFRRATAAERELALAIVEELRPVEYKATGTLQRSLDPAGRLSRGDFDALLEAMTRSGLVAIEEATYEKDGEVRRYRKVRLTERGLEMRRSSAVELLIADGMVEAGASRVRKTERAEGKKRRGQAVAGEAELTTEGAALAAKLKSWRAAEAKRLGLPAYMVLHDRTLDALARMRPRNPREMLDVDGMGPAKMERFGAAILELCGQG